jgi:hypothetical protein
MSWSFPLLNHIGILAWFRDPTGTTKALFARLNAFADVEKAFEDLSSLSLFCFT